VPWYARSRDLPNPPYGKTSLYGSLDELRTEFGTVVKAADLVVVGSYVPEGVAVGEWVTSVRRKPTAFYDIDTPVTLAKLEAGDYEYLNPSLIAKYDLYLSFAGGPTLRRLEHRFGSPMARPFYCSFDPDLYFPEPRESKWDFGYMGTYSDDRQPGLDRLLLEPARQWADGRFVVAGPLYPPSIEWSANVERIDHLAPSDHRAFYNAQRFTLNITRADMIKAGYSPSVRLFEAAACATPIISDNWDGLETVFEIGSEILVARSSDEALDCLRNISDQERRRIGARAHERVMSAHTAAHRAAELEAYALEVLAR
jgi:spore maturation protein CgeB